MLATATQATLRKLKKAVLVEMCEARELDTEGTKEQLSQWLIEWVSAQIKQSCDRSACSLRPYTLAERLCFPLNLVRVYSSAGDS